MKIDQNIPLILLVRPFPDRDAWEIPKSHKHERKTVMSWLACQNDINETPYTADKENAEIRWFSFDALPTLHVYQRPLIQEVIEKVWA